MSYKIQKPSSSLSSFIKQYWMVENCLDPGVSHTQKIIPSGLMELSFFKNKVPIKTDGSEIYPGKSVITGLFDGHFDLNITGELSMFSITFQPLGAYIFFNIPMIEFLNRSVTMNTVKRDLAVQMENQLFEADSFEGRIVITENILIKLLLEKERDFDLQRIHHCLKVINEKKGLTDLNSLSQVACLSSKQFERVFKKIIGISPKKFLRIVRFQNSVHSWSINPQPMTQLAYESGYYDQSHMIHDYNDLAGMRPKDFFSGKDIPFSDYFS